MSNAAAAAAAAAAGGSSRSEAPMSVRSGLWDASE